MKAINWHNLSLQEVFKQLRVSSQGLTAPDAISRLKEFGQNKLPETKKIPGLIILADQFKNVLVYILLIAVVINLFLGELVDLAVILLAVFINVFVGYLQEQKAQNALFSLRKIITRQALVLRDGLKKKMMVENLVPGDIIFLENGSLVPADARLIQSQGLQVNEASLTGESMPQEKQAGTIKDERILAERSNMVYSGTVVAAGQARAVVCATGVQTELGHIVVLIREIERERTPLQKKLDHFSQYLGILVVVICLLLFLLGILLRVRWSEMFLMVVAVAVSAIPEGLLIAVTVILAVGMQKILKKKGLVRKMVAAETLGSTSVICVDKTGTLTTGQMKVKEIVTADGVLDFTQSLVFETMNPVFLKALEIGMLCNNAQVENPQDSGEKWRLLGLPTEKALLLAGLATGLRSDLLNKKYPRLDEIPFSSVRKIMATLHRSVKNRVTVYFKGAPEKILAFSGQILTAKGVKKLSTDQQKRLLLQHEAWSKKGYRVLAAAYREFLVDKNKLKDLTDYAQELIFVGFYVIEDPLRPEAKEVLRLARQAGIRTVVITGDHHLTAKKIGDELGLIQNPEAILDGQKLAAMSDEELAGKIEEITIYARTNPEDKLRLVRAWQKKGAVVAMTGDGVNDAPAIQRADIGIALGSGTDVAHQTADLVLLDDNFKTILAAIEGGRVIYDNIRKVILYLLSDSFTEVILVSVALIIGFITKDFPLPILATQILWINIVDDSFPSIALSFDPKEKEVMREKPQEREKPILDKSRKILIGLISLVTAISNLLLFYFFWQKTKDVALARTVVFTTLALDSLLYVFSCRSLRHSIFNKKIFTNKYLLGAIGFGVTMQLLAVYLPFLQKVFRTVPLNMGQWGIILLVCLGVILLIELVKYLFIIQKKKI